MGGKSSSSSTSTQEVTDQSVSGVVTLDTLLQGKTVNYTNEFGETTADIFKQFINTLDGAGQGLIDIASKSLDLNAAGQDRALTEVSTQTTQRENPDLAVINKFAPILMMGVVGLVAYLILGKK